MRDSFALGDGPYHFFDRSSRSAAASSICSASSFFNLAFLKLAQSLSLRDVHAAELCLPIVQRRFRDPVLPRKIGGLRTRLMLAQHADNLLFRKPGSLHLSVLQKAGL
jgi:hypothetical protein